MTKVHDDAVVRNRHILYCVIKAVIFLDKKRFPYRGSGHSEAAYNLADIGHHGNFLDVIKLIASFDKDLAGHLDNVTKKAIRKKARIARQHPVVKKRARGVGIRF